MIKQRRSAIIATLILIVLFIGSVFSYRYLCFAEADANHASKQLAECRSLVARINATKNRPTIAQGIELADEELAQLIDQARERAKMPPASLRSIRPESSRRIGKTDYTQRPIRVDIRSVNLKQLICLLHDLSMQNSALRISNIRLSEPRNDDATDHWNAEIVITHLVYAPKEKISTNKTSTN